MPATDDPRHAAQPEVAAALAHMQQAAWAATDPELLGRCHRRVAALLGGEQEDDDDAAATPPSERDAAFLAFTDQFVFSVASVGDRDVEALLAHAEPVDVYRFVAALYSLEMSMRIEIATRAVLAPEEVPS